MKKSSLQDRIERLLREKGYEVRPCLDEEGLMILIEKFADTASKTEYALPVPTLPI